MQRQPRTAPAEDRPPLVAIPEARLAVVPEARVVEAGEAGEVPVLVALVARVAARQAQGDRPGAARRGPTMPRSPILPDTTVWPSPETVA